MTALQRIRAETGQSAVESIKWYAETGYSRTYTALSLEVSRPTLNKICNRFNLNQYFKPQRDQVEGCRQNGGKGGIRLSTRKPIMYNGVIYHPSDPTSLMLYQTLDIKDRLPMAKAAKLFLQENKITC